jgi:hypothetical protein
VLTGRQQAVISVGTGVAGTSIRTLWLVERAEERENMANRKKIIPLTCSHVRLVTRLFIDFLLPHTVGTGCEGVNWI